MQSLKRAVPILSAVLLLAGADGSSAQFKMQAATSLPGPGLHIVLTWPEAPGVARFNLYRKTNPASPYPATPLNPQPIAMMTNCGQIQGIIPSGSEEWNLMATALADSAGAPPFDPCAVGTVPRGSEKFARLQFLARAKWKIALVVGQGYDDGAVVGGTTYYYELRGVNNAGAETGTLDTDVSITAGVPLAVPAPTGLTAQAGDSKVLLLWDDMPEAAGFNVYRATAVMGPYQRINEASFTSRIQFDFDGEPLKPDSSTVNGFVDFQRWDASGNPTTHLVNGIAISGPSNGVTYYYKVGSVDLLGKEGPLTAVPVSAKPIDKTPPRAPQEVTVTPDEVASRLEIRWPKVTYDADGHVESSVAGYRVYRYEAPGNPDTLATPIGGLIPQPGPGTIYLAALDADPALRPPYGEKSFWYRVDCRDAAGNVSSRSAAVAGHLRDITPPSPPQGVDAEGFDAFIRVRWKLNTEPDLDGYLIYRSLCDFGDWVPCDREQPTTTHVPGKRPCSGPFVLIGNLSQAEAESLAAVPGGTPFFDDHTVPKGSPLCYAYLVKAQDHAQNKSGSWPIPNLTTEMIVCQRLRDKTPPEPAILSGLLARDQAILVEWIGAPVQDIKAYHVYRSENETGPYTWVGGMTVEVPPAPPVVLTSPYHPPPFVGCDSLPLQTRDDMSAGSFLDTQADPKRIYWYKVLGVDQSGNETAVEKAVPISTFTFSTKQPDTPTITSITENPSPCALVVRWSPTFDATKHLGFALFRSESTAGLYRQVGSLVAANEYVDTEVVRGVEYWYKVLQMDLEGKVSPLSPAKSGKVAP